ncbi:MAG: hypothetical protein ACRC14_08655 [Paracoccaceae bacterium]
MEYRDMRQLMKRLAIGLLPTAGGFQSEQVGSTQTSFWQDIGSPPGVIHVRAS